MPPFYTIQFKQVNAYASSSPRVAFLLACDSTIGSPTQRSIPCAGTVVHESGTDRLGRPASDLLPTARQGAVRQCQAASRALPCWLSPSCSRAVIRNIPP